MFREGLGLDYIIETTYLIIFLVLMIVPGLYGLHMYALMFLAHRRNREVRARNAAVVARFRRETIEDCWPRVTTQLPLYNEVAVARRVIEAAARMDYPRDRHEIQVLDDSSDQTRQVVDQVCAELQAEGYDVKVIRRPNRRHYKAGALEYGLVSATGEYIAIFDADFVPDRGFLRRMIPLVASDPGAACVQGRWGHLNANESWLTQALSLGIDGHFGVEQGARGWNGFLLNFNGTGGIWRRAAIDDPRVGGWSGDTITEDLDLSYRVQLSGWRILYNIDEECPAEVPADIDAIKAQQRRWATGSMQCARKLLPAVWRAKLPLLTKLEASIHVTQYSVSVFMVLMAALGRVLLCGVPEERYKPFLTWSWWLVLLAAVAPSAAYVYARWSLTRQIVGLRSIVKLVVLGLGISVNNAFAVMVGLVQRGGEFVRTPKSGSSNRAASRLPYQTIRSRLWLLEIALGVHCFAQWIVFLPADRYVGGTFLLFYAIGLIHLGWESRPQSIPAGVLRPVPLPPPIVEAPAAPDDANVPAPAMRANL